MGPKAIESRKERPKSQRGKKDRWDRNLKSGGMRLCAVKIDWGGTPEVLPGPFCVVNQ